MRATVARAQALAIAVTGVALVAGCSSSAKGTPTSQSAQAASPSPSTPAIGSSGAGTGSSAFCTALGAYGRQFKDAFADNKLTAMKAALPKVVFGGNALAARAPTAIRPDLTDLAADISKFNRFVQTTATQHILDGSKVPAQVAAPLADLQVKGTAVKSWDQTNCNAVFGS